MHAMINPYIDEFEEEGGGRVARQISTAPPYSPSACAVLTELSNQDGDKALCWTSFYQWRDKIAVQEHPTLNPSTVTQSTWPRTPIGSAYSQETWANLTDAILATVAFLLLVDTECIETSGTPGSSDLCCPLLFEKLCSKFMEELTNFLGLPVNLVLRSKWPKRAFTVFMPRFMLIER